jgi:hypothetical protein
VIRGALANHCGIVVYLSEGAGYTTVGCCVEVEVVRTYCAV